MLSLKPYRLPGSLVQLLFFQKLILLSLKSQEERPYRNWEWRVEWGQLIRETNSQALDEQAQPTTQTVRRTHLHYSVPLQALWTVQGATSQASVQGPNSTGAAH